MNGPRVDILARPSDNTKNNMLDCWIEHKIVRHPEHDSNMDPVVMIIQAESQSFQNVDRMCRNTF